MVFIIALCLLALLQLFVWFEVCKDLPLETLINDSGKGAQFFVNNSAVHQRLFHFVCISCKETSVFLTGAASRDATGGQRQYITATN